jgi:hypothetical protein
MPPEVITFRAIAVSVKYARVVDAKTDRQIITMAMANILFFMFASLLSKNRNQSILYMLYAGHTRKSEVFGFPCIPCAPKGAGCRMIR